MVTAVEATHTGCGGTWQIDAAGTATCSSCGKTLT